MNTRTLTVVVSAAALVALAGGCRRHAKRQAKQVEANTSAPAQNAEGFQSEESYSWESSNDGFESSSESTAQSDDWSNSWDDADSFGEDEANFGAVSGGETASAEGGFTTDPFEDEFGFGFVPKFETPVTELSKEQVQAELESMVEVDKAVVEATAEREGFEDPAFTELVRQIDQIQGARLAEIVDVWGWPTADEFGNTAAQGAFVAVQHCSYNPEFQNHCLGLLVDKVNEGKVQPQYVALLTDRIRMFKDEPQLFGTQMKFEFDVDGVARPVPQVPIENPEELDNRRALMGMPPHAEFVKVLEAAYAAQQPTASVETDSDN